MMTYYSVYTIDSDPYVRLDKASTNCRKGVTVKCGNVCRKPENCKLKPGGAQYKSLLAQKRAKAKEEKNPSNKPKIFKDIGGRKLTSTKNSKGITLTDKDGARFTIPKKDLDLIQSELDQAINNPSYKVSIDRHGNDLKKSLSKQQGWQIKMYGADQSGLDSPTVTIQDFENGLLITTSPKALKYALK